MLRPVRHGRLKPVVAHRRQRSLIAEYGEQGEVPCEIRTLSATEATAMRTAENGQREDRSVIADAELAARVRGVAQPL